MLIPFSAEIVVSYGKKYWDEDKSFIESHAYPQMVYSTFVSRIVERIGIPPLSDAHGSESIAKKSRDLFEGKYSSRQHQVVLFVTNRHLLLLDLSVGCGCS